MASPELIAYKRHFICAGVAIAAVIGIKVPLSQQDALLAKHQQADTTLAMLNGMAGQAKTLRGQVHAPFDTPNNTWANCGLSHEATFTLRGSDATVHFKSASIGQVYDCIDSMRRNASGKVKEARFSTTPNGGLQGVIEITFPGGA